LSDLKAGPPKDVDTYQNRIRITGAARTRRRRGALAARPARINMEGNGQNESALPDKDLFRIGEVSRLTATKQFVLRYWESEFPMLQPVKSPKGHRLYRRQDIETVFLIKRLLYDEGFTIAGARRHLRDQGIGASASSSSSEARSSEGPPAQASLALNRKTLLDLRDSLRSFLTLLEHE
jgi:DNA-binding transcriptional MerR regulator